MTKKQRVYSAFLIFGLFFLFGCDKSTNSTELSSISLDSEEIILTLYNQDTELIIFGDLAWNSVVELPILTEEGKVFIGWSNQEDLFYGEYTVTQSESLYAVFENIEDVFSYIVIPSTLDSETLVYDTVQIHYYTGIAKHLVVPQMIDGMYVVSIGEEAFTESRVVDVELPMDVVIGYHAFYMVTTLESVTFYGEYLIPYNDTFTQDEMDEVLDQYGDACTIVSGSVEEKTYTFSEGCPIIEVTNVESHLIGGINYTIYFAINNPTIILKSNRISFPSVAFEGDLNLTTVEIPYGDSYFFADALKGCHNITTLIVDEDHPNFKVVDGVLFNADLTRLLYYPSGLTNLSYTIPSTAVPNADAFYENTTLETLIIPEDYTGLLLLTGLYGLKEILVEGNNTDYQSIDGVLYSGDKLVKYPANKSGDSFNIPDFVTEIDNFAFFGNRNLISVNLTPNVETIGYMSFSEVQSIQVLVIPSSVWYIEGYCFQDAQIKTILLYRSSNIDGSITRVSSNLGSIDVEGFAIYVVDDSFNEYCNELGWVRYIDQIHPLSEYLGE